MTGDHRALNLDPYVVLKALVEITSPHLGTAFLRVLAEQLARLFDGDLAFVASISPDHPGQASIIGAWPPDLTGMSYPLAGTPCEEVYCGSLVTIASGVSRDYPADADHGFETFLGIPLSGPDGQCTGHLAVYGKTARPFDPNIEEIARLFARRVESETERLALEKERERSAQEIRENHQRLEATLDELRATQSQLIQAEKIASLGTLIANVAHEINTPIGAVKSSGQTIAAEVERTLNSMPRLFDMLEAGPRELFIRLVRHAAGPLAALSSREERALTRVVAQTLDQAGIDNASRKADVLVQLRADTAPLDYRDLLQHKEAEFILETAQGIASIVHGTRNINASVERVSRIVTTLRSFAQSESSGPIAEIDLRESIDNVLAVYQNQFRQNTTLICDYQSVRPVRARAQELNQVWMHLIQNALQAMNHKGQLTIRLRAEVNDAVVTVTDSGGGIPEQIRNRIFEPFFTTRAPGEGAGLGLGIVKKIIDLHHGRVEVQTAIGEGSTFTIYLPMITGE